jgi:beta-ureidopropionase / N-carbamoyl-L-amino-acid hydrolase
VLRDSARRLGLRARSLASGAGHDMAFISQVAPAAMVFIPCKDGRSHTPEEWATAEALTAGAEVLLEAILEVDRTTASP